MDLTDFIAVIGLVLSVTAIIWNILRDVGDKGKIKIEGCRGELYPDHTNKDYLIIIITNIGKRPVWIKGLYGDENYDGAKLKGYIFGTRGLPRILKESEYHTEFLDWNPEKLRGIKEISVRDSRGKDWKMCKKNFKQIMKEVSEDLKVIHNNQ